MTLFLAPHPASPPRAVRSVNVNVSLIQGRLHLLYVVEGDPERVKLPACQKPYRAEGLWRTTCFELFLRDEGTAYREFNFSPSSQWAAYGFSDYRVDRESLALKEPPKSVLCPPEQFGLMLSASLLAEITPNTRFGTTAVIEETDGTISYWAATHSSPDKPDFHDPSCITLELPAATAS
jgi:hypothetical protein